MPLVQIALIFAANLLIKGVDQIGRRGRAQGLPPLGSGLATAGCPDRQRVEAHRQALAEYETERVVFEAQKDAVRGGQEAAKKKVDPAAIAKELRTHTDGAPSSGAAALPDQRQYGREVGRTAEGRPGRLTGGSLAETASAQARMKSL